MNSNHNQGFSPTYGLVPLYPLPSLNFAKETGASTSSKPLSGDPLTAISQHRTIFPPIFSRQYDSYAVEELAPIEVDRILGEVITAEILDMFKELLDKGGNFLDLVIRQDIERKNAKNEKISKSIARKILEEVIEELCRETVHFCLDDFIHDHSREILSRLFTEDFVVDVVDELIVEILQEAIRSSISEKKSSEFFEHFLQEEMKNVVDEVLMHYGAKIAFSQYKQISQFAFDNVLDDMCMQVVLPRAKTTFFDVDYLMNDMIFSILLHKIIEFDTCYKKEECLPIIWYRKKLLQTAALDAALEELCRDDNNSFQH